MCTDAMATAAAEVKRVVMEGRMSSWRRKRVVCWGQWRAAVRRRWWRKPGQRMELRVRRAGAMAPRNTTQYLMELVYCDLNITQLSSPPALCEEKHMYSYTEEQDSMDFQRRDFERVLFHNEI